MDEIRIGETEPFLDIAENEFTVCHDAEQQKIRCIILLFRYGPDYTFGISLKAYFGSEGFVFLLSVVSESVLIIPYPLFMISSQSNALACS